MATVLKAQAPTREEIAARVRKGVTWLHEHAPYGWQGHMFFVEREGTNKLSARPRFTSRYDDTCVLAFAFQSAPGVAATGGAIAELYNLGLEDLRIYGFDMEPDHQDLCPLLDWLWVEALTSYAGQNLSGRREVMIKEWKPPCAKKS